MNRLDKPASDFDPLAFLIGGGEMGALIQSMDWSKTSLGPVAGWPQSLRTTVSICLTSDLPTCVIWGPELVQLYNDAYRVICGNKHPLSMGQNFAECWREAWPVIGEAHNSALAGDKAFFETQHIFLERHGFLEECFFTFSFSPIRDEAGRVGGLFHPFIEMTSKVLSDRRTRALRDLAAQTSKAKSVDEVLALSAHALAEYVLDLPFVLLYALEPHGVEARLVGATGLHADTVARLRSACLNNAQTVWPFEEVVRARSAVRVDGVRERIARACVGADGELPNAALVIPIIAPGADRPTAVFIAGLSPGLPLNDAYRSFLDLLASGVIAAVANASAYEDERRRVEANLQIARQRREANEALRASEERNRVLFEHTADGIVLADATGRYVEVNAAACRILGYSREEMLARTIPDVLEPGEWSRIAPEIARYANGQVVRSEWRFRRKDGSVFIGEITGSQLPDGRVQGILRDVTERRATEAAIRVSEERVRSILESITDGFFVLDHDWHITHINKAGERILDRTHGDLIGKSIWDEFPGTLESEFERMYRRVAAAQVGESLTAYYPNFDRWYELNANPAPEGLAVYFRDVTDRRQVEQERQQFAALVEASPDFIGVAGLDQRGVYVNRAGMELSGLEPGQLNSITVLDFFPESERDRILGFIAGSESGKQVVVDTYFQHLRTGQLIPVSWSFLRLRDTSGNVSGYATVTRDLTKRNKAEEQLRASEERRRLALDAAELGTWHVEPATRATKTDARYRTSFGTTEEWTDYFQAFAVIHPDDLPAVKEAVAAATRLEDPIPFAIEYRISHPDGSLRWVLANGRSSFEGAGPTRRVLSFDGTVADITKRKQSEQERERLVVSLREQDQRKDEFLATLAHELRNPLAPIRSGLQIMRLAKDDPQAAERVLPMMERQLGQMVHLIDDLLDLSRISRGKIDLRKERIELARAIHQAVETSLPLIEQANHELLIEISPDPIHVDADLTRLAQVFTNLLNNAAKYTERGGRIRLTVQSLKAEVVVSVQDNGIGIPTDMLAHVFEMFTQVNRHLDRAQGGLGVGLSIVRRLVQMHGGSVEARSDGNGRGSEFVVRLPMALLSVGDESSNQPDTARATARRRILIADDNRDAADSLAMMLTMTGYETQTAHDGMQALDVAAAFRPDVMLLDIGMPKLNGHEVCRRLRQEAWGKDMVVIALTGWGQEEDKRRSLEAGFNFHMVKPVQPAALEDLLTRANVVGA